MSNFRKFLNNFKKRYNHLFPPKLRNKNSGYVALLLVIFVPLIMLGTKWALDLMTMHDIMITSFRGKPVFPSCAEKAAQAVAKNWNPGKSLDHQKRAVLKIADKIYNDGLNAIEGVPILAKAVPGIQLSVKEEVIPGKGFDPIIVKKRAIAETVNPITYRSAPKYYIFRKLHNERGSPLCVSWNLPFVAWKVVDKLSSLTTSYDKFDELDQNELQSGNYVLNHFDRFRYPHQWWIRSAEGFPKRNQFLNWGDSGVDIIYQVTSSIIDNTEESGFSLDFAKNATESSANYIMQGSSVEDGNYTYREKEDDNRVQVSIVGDKIKVKAGNDTGYATPEECNVDIVLACPTNGAATNKDNYDQNSNVGSDLQMPYTSDDPLDTVNNDVESCPIYQIGQAFRELAKQFYHKKGVTMALIPYSGKVSLDPDSNAAKTGAVEKRYQDFYFKQTDYLNQNSYQAYLRGATLYNSYGSTDKELNNGYEWNTLLTACPIQCRAGMHIGELDAKTGGNFVHSKDLLNTNIPNYRGGNASPEFFRQNSNPCYGGYANLLTMRCEKDCTTYLPNPYYIIEPTADVQKIYELCGALYPFYDEHNVSNFLFIPITWANNLWQSWTRDPVCDAVDTDASGNGGQLSVPSKMTAGRKKILILVINKPDWFEPHELTYVGFDNDLSEIPMVESDRIDFSQNYSDTSKKFEDGSSYDGTIQGPKKILKFEVLKGSLSRAASGYYECSDADVVEAKLSFPKKYLVKIVMAEKPPVWETKSINLGYVSPSISHIGVGPIKGKERLLSMGVNGTLRYSDDAVTWNTLKSLGGSQQWYRGAAYQNGIWCIFQSQGNQGYYSTDEGETWNLVTVDGLSGQTNIAAGNGIFMICNNDDGKTFISSDARNWTSYDGAFFSRTLCYGNGRWIVGPSNNLHESTDNGKTWQPIGSSLFDTIGESSIGEYYCGTYALGYFYAAYLSPLKIARSRDGTNWQLIADINCSNKHRHVTYYNGKLYSFGESNTCCHIGTLSITKFTNLSASGSTDANKDYPISEKNEFYIESSQIADDCTITFNLQNVRLVSAEITNRPYTKITPTCSLNGTNIKTNCKRAMTIKVTPKSSGSSTITFYDDNKIEDNVGTHTITAPTTFTFSGAQVKAITYFTDGTLSTLGKNFAHNLSKYKVRYSASATKITVAELSKQFIRHYGGNYNRNYDGKKLIANDGTMAPQLSAGAYGRYVYCHSTIEKNADFCLQSSAISFVNGSGYNDLKANGTVRIYGFDPKSFYIWINGGRFGATIEYDGVSRNIGSKTSGIQFSSIHISGNSVVNSAYNEFSLNTQEINQVFFENTLNLSLLNTTIDTTGSQNTNIEQNKGIALQRLSSDISEQIVAGDYICFQGDGELSVTVEPTTGTNGLGSITHTTPNGTGITENYTGYHSTITIDPDNYEYEEDDGYVIRLTANNVTLSELQFVDQSPLFEWDKIRTPEMSRWINSSQNPYELNACTDNGKFANYWIYRNGFYVNKGTGGYGVLIRFEDIIGDYQSFSYSDNTYTMLHYRSDGYIGGNRPKNQYPVSGLSRTYTPFNLVVDNDRALGNVCNDLSGQAGTISMIMQTLTFPVNTALYYAYYDGNVHKGEWYKDSEENYDYDASAAAKNATLAACEKLKEDFGENLRIYLIKYRKQVEYKHKITSAVTKFDYDYLDKCTGNIYDVSSQAELNEAVKTVSNDVREFASNKFNVVLNNAGLNSTELIKVICEITGLSQNAAQELINTLPCTIKTNVPPEEALEMKEKLEAAGATVELE